MIVVVVRRSILSVVKRILLLHLLMSHGRRLLWPRLSRHVRIVLTDDGSDTLLRVVVDPQTTTLVLVATGAALLAQLERSLKIEVAERRARVITTLPGGGCRVLIELLIPIVIKVVVMIWR